MRRESRFSPINCSEEGRIERGALLAQGGFSSPIDSKAHGHLISTLYSGLDCAVRSHLTLPLSVMLGYVAAELQVPIPIDFLERLRQRASQANTIERELALWGAHASSRGRFKNLLRVSESWRSQMFVLRWILFPSPRYLCQVLQICHPWWLPFYYLSRPSRYVARRVWLYCKHRWQRPAKRGNLLTA